MFAQPSEQTLPEGIAVASFQNRMKEKGAGLMLSLKVNNVPHPSVNSAKTPSSGRLDSNQCGTPVAEVLLSVIA